MWNNKGEFFLNSEEIKLGFSRFKITPTVKPTFPGNKNGLSPPFYTQCDAREFGDSLFLFFSFFWLGGKALALGPARTFRENKRFWCRKLFCIENKRENSDLQLQFLCFLLQFLGFQSISKLQILLGKVYYVWQTNTQDPRKQFIHNSSKADFNRNC